MPTIPPPPVPVADSQPTALTRYALQDINTPCQTDGFYVELVSRTDPAYMAANPIKRGTAYASVMGADSRIVAQYAANPLYFVRQTADIDSMRVMFNSQYDNYVLWIWATQTLSQNSYNSHVTYADESLTTPRFERVSTIKRNVWEANPTLAYQSALTAMIAVTLSAGGSGYGALDANGTVTPTIGTVGNAAAEAVVLNGVIIDWIVTIEGSGIGSGANLTITGSGTGGVATAIIQPAGAILVHQEKKELSAEDPLSHDYVQIVQTWETLPSVILIEWDQDEETQVNVKTTFQVVANPVSAPSATAGILISYRKIDAVKSMKIVRDFTAFLAFSFTEQKFGADQFPALFDYTTYFWSDPCGAFFSIRSAFSCKTQIITTVTYTTTQQSTSGLILKPKSLQLGRGFQMNQQVLVDDGSITYLGSCTGTASWTGSDPTYTDYITLIQGTMQVTAAESVLWKAGLYKNTSVSEFMV